MRETTIIILLMTLQIFSFAQQDLQPVEVRKTSAGYQLFRGNEAYYIKGAGILDHYDILARCGGNSVRTWGISEWETVFSQAEKNGLTVCAGIWMEQERQGFDYSDPDTVRKQFQQIKEAVLRYKDHPSLLIWGIGNELDLNYTDPAVWDAVEDIARFIHEVDGNHPTMTVTAFIEKEEVKLIKDRCPNIDILGVNCYASLPALPRVIREFGWDGPYLVAEWGTFGHWEVGRTPWGEPLEITSSEKANLYMKEYNEYIKVDPLSLGSYVFLWGSKQERTTTWYSMFLPGGEKTEVVDVMHKLWKGVWPENRAPRLISLKLLGKQAADGITVRPGQELQAAVDVDDPEGDVIKISWEILHETTDKRTGGDREEKPAPAENIHIRQTGRSLVFTAPISEGPYRLFVFVLDQKGSGAHANIPFFVRE